MQRASLEKINTSVYAADVQNILIVYDNKRSNAFLHRLHSKHDSSFIKALRTFSSHLQKNNNDTLNKLQIYELCKILINIEGKIDKHTQIAISQLEKLIGEQEVECLKLAHKNAVFNTLTCGIVLSCQPEILPKLSKCLNDVSFNHCVFLISKSFNISSEILNWLVTECTSFSKLDEILSNHDTNGCLHGWCLPLLDDDLPEELSEALAVSDDINMDGKFGCQLLITNEKPDIDNIASLQLKSNAAYILFGENFWYMNKFQKVLVEFDLSSTDTGKERCIRGFTLIHQEYGESILSFEPLKMISELIKHDHNESFITFNQSRILIDNLKAEYLNRLEKLSCAGPRDKSESDVNRLLREMAQLKILSLSSFQFIVKNPRFMSHISYFLRACRYNNRNQETLKSYAVLIFLLLKSCYKFDSGIRSGLSIENKDSILRFFQNEKEFLQEILPFMMPHADESLVIYCVWKLYTHNLLLPQYFSIVSTGGDIRSKINLICLVNNFETIPDDFIALIAIHPQPQKLLSELENQLHQSKEDKNKLEIIHRIFGLAANSLDRAQIIETSHMIAQLKRHGIQLFQLPKDILAIIAGYVSDRHSPTDATNIAKAILFKPGILDKRLEKNPPLNDLDSQKFRQQKKK